MRVLVGVDGSSFSDAALDEVSKRPRPEGTEILVVHAFEPPLAATPEGWVLPPNYCEELDRTVNETANSITKSAVDRVKSSTNGVKVTGKALLGSPKRGVVAAESLVDQLTGEHQITLI